MWVVLPPAGAPAFYRQPAAGLLMLKSSRPRRERRGREGQEEDADRGARLGMSARRPTAPARRAAVRAAHPARGRGVRAQGRQPRHLHRDRPDGSSIKVGQPDLRLRRRRPDHVHGHGRRQRRDQHSRERGALPRCLRRPGRRTRSIINVADPITGNDQPRTRAHDPADGSGSGSRSTTSPGGSGCRICRSDLRSPIDRQPGDHRHDQPARPNGPIPAPVRPHRRGGHGRQQQLLGPGVERLRVLGRGSDASTTRSGIPSGSGNNKRQFFLDFSPTITKGVNASASRRPRSQPAPRRSTSAQPRRPTASASRTPVRSAPTAATAGTSTTTARPTRSTNSPDDQPSSTRTRAPTRPS